MDNEKDIVRENVLEAIKRSGLSRFKVTQMAGISYPHFSRVLNNKGGELGIGILRQLSKTLDVPVSYFFGDTDVDGEQILSSSGKPLTEEWDQLFKRINKLPKDEQGKVLKIASSVVEVFE